MQYVAFTAPRWHSGLKPWLSQIFVSLMNPEEYCKKWVPEFRGVTPDDWGYRKICIEELSKITGLSEGTISGWGKHFEKAPAYAHKHCAMADALNQIAKTAKLPD